MTHGEWQSATRVYDMLRALRARKSPWQWTTRKARLFACGCCRRAWHLLTEPAQRAAVEAAERAADKQLRPGELAAAHRAPAPIRLGIDSSLSACLGGRVSKGGWDFFVDVSSQREMRCNPGALAAVPTAWGNPYGAANDVRALVHFRAGSGAARDEQHAQCDLLRDLVGPVRPLPAVADTWLAANGSAVPDLARGVYEERAFDRLPILADALEDAGCTNAEVLGHLRSGGPHGRGCWAVDLLLGRG